MFQLYCVSVVLIVVIAEAPLKLKGLETPGIEFPEVLNGEIFEEIRNTFKRAPSSDYPAPSIIRSKNRKSKFYKEVHY